MLALAVEGCGRISCGNDVPHAVDDVFMLVGADAYDKAIAVVRFMERQNLFQVSYETPVIPTKLYESNWHTSRDEKEIVLSLRSGLSYHEYQWLAGEIPAKRLKQLTMTAMGKPRFALDYEDEDAINALTDAYLAKFRTRANKVNSMRDIMPEKDDRPIITTQRRGCVFEPRRGPV